MACQISSHVKNPFKRFEKYSLKIYLAPCLKKVIAGWRFCHVPVLLNSILSIRMVVFVAGPIRSAIYPVSSCLAASNDESCLITSCKIGYMLGDLA